MWGIDVKHCEHKKKTYNWMQGKNKHFKLRYKDWRQKTEDLRLGTKDWILRTKDWELRMLSTVNIEKKNLI